MLSEYFLFEIVNSRNRHLEDDAVFGGAWLLLLLIVVVVVVQVGVVEQPFDLETKSGFYHMYVVWKPFRFLLFGRVRESLLEVVISPCIH
jgi:hypothetical protein